MLKSFQSLILNQKILKKDKNLSGAFHFFLTPPRPPKELVSFVKPPSKWTQPLIVLQFYLSPQTVVSAFIKI